MMPRNQGFPSDKIEEYVFRCCFLSSLTRIVVHLLNSDIMESIIRALDCHLLLECKQPGSHGICTLATFSSFTRQRWSGIKLRKRQVRASLSVDRAAVREEAIEKPVAASCLSKKAIGNKPECTSCQAKGLVLCTTCSGSGLYVDSILESQGIIVKVRCLGCGGAGSVMCPDCRGNGCI